MEQKANSRALFKIVCVAKIKLSISGFTRYEMQTNKEIKPVSDGRECCQAS